MTANFLLPESSTIKSFSYSLISPGLFIFFLDNVIEGSALSGDELNGAAAFVFAMVLVSPLELEDFPRKKTVSVWNWAIAINKSRGNSKSCAFKYPILRRYFEINWILITTFSSSHLIFQPPISCFTQGQHTGGGRHPSLSKAIALMEERKVSTFFFMDELTRRILTRSAKVSSLSMYLSTWGGKWSILKCIPYDNEEWM